MATLGKRIKELREHKNLTQRELAEIMGYKTTRSVQFLEADQRSLDHYQLIYLADFFDVSLDYLVGRSDDTRRR
ncbi:MAG: HTH-type transcriptional regulator ImmR [Pelotomaculum sp. PtaB.Bin104]|nr:MAG: HTH-type transcriptional regulator ImmR [Pelotomaculum sp. PtaB.Bin104]